MQPLHAASVFTAKTPHLRTSWRALHLALPGIALAILVIVPFINKAHTIDDSIYMGEAVHALHDPLHPTAFDMVWTSEVIVRTSKWVPVGPGIAWLLLPAAALGGSEWVAHLVGLLLLLAALIATTGLALRIGLTPLQAGAACFLNAATVPVLIMADSSMPDVHAMAFGVFAMERLATWRDERRIYQAVAAAVFLACAVILRTNLIGLVGVGAVWMIDWRDRSRVGILRQLVSLAPLAVAVALVWMIIRITADPAPSGSTVGGSVQRTLDTSLSHINGNGRAFLAHWTILLPLALPWVILRFRRFGVWAAALGVAAMPILWWLWPDHARWLNPAYSFSAVALVGIVIDAWRSRDHVRIALALWLFISAPVILYTHFPSKYLAGSAPAAAIVVASLVNRRRVARLQVAACMTVVAAQIVLAILILKADSEMSGAARLAAIQLIRPRVERGIRVWYDGQFGFHWYAERAGAVPLSLNGPKPSRGDIIVRSLYDLHECKVMSLIPTRKLLGVVHSPPGGRIMSSGAGFYRNWTGMLPWVWADDDANRFEVWEVE